MSEGAAAAHLDARGARLLQQVVEPLEGGLAELAGPGLQGVLGVDGVRPGAHCVEAQG
jgi:hypothetical protein